MGYLAVKTMVAHLKGQPVEKRIDTGVHVATKDNMDDARDEGAAGAGPEEVIDLADSSGEGRATRFGMRGIRKSFGATVALAAWISPSPPARSAGSSARTAPARAR